jgi:hypothetical protein
MIRTQSTINAAFLSYENFDFPLDKMCFPDGDPLRRCEQELLFLICTRYRLTINDIDSEVLLQKNQKST